MFAGYGVPGVLISDNGPQFASEELAGFVQKWGFEHITSSPHYPQSNWKAENAVKTVKRLFSKCKETNCSELMVVEYTYKELGVKSSPKIAGSMM